MAGQRDGVLLTSWKEISAYMGRSVRTVQRWEKLGLPVRRLSSSSKASVLANTRDIDTWLSNARTHGFATRQSAEHLFLRGSLAEAVNMSRILRAEMMKLREERRQDMVTLVNTLEKLIDSLKTSEVSLALEQKHPPPKYRQ